MKILNRLCTTHLLRQRVAESRDRLYRVALAWCGDEMLADDLVQETLICAVRKCQQVRDPKKLNAWLYSVLQNTWRQYLRRQRVTSELSEEHLTMEITPESAVSQMEASERVRYAVARLPMDQRQVIALVDLEGLAYCEVAQVLEIPMGTVMSRLHRARKNLGTALEEMDQNPKLPHKGHLRRVK